MAPRSTSHGTSGRLTIVGGGRESRECRRGCWETVCTRGSDRALLRGPSTSPLGGCSPCRAHSLRSRTAAASSAKILPIELWRCDMKDHGSGDVRFSEALALWLPGAFSLALLAFSLADLFTAPHIPIPWYQAMMLIAVLGGSVPGALLEP